MPDLPSAETPKGQRPLDPEGHFPDGAGTEIRGFEMTDPPDTPYGGPRPDHASIPILPPDAAGVKPPDVVPDVRRDGDIRPADLLRGLDDSYFLAADDSGTPERGPDAAPPPARTSGHNCQGIS